jgi:cyclic pyranopterin phosphate synthase
VKQQMHNPFSHTNQDGIPGMVNVGHKIPTYRTAKASGRVIFPASVFAELQRLDFVAAKGSIVQSAIIAGTMAAKQTDKLIPFCHSLPLDRCKIQIEIQQEQRCMKVFSEVATYAKTGVEMEALTAVSVACLCIYDMVKALGHDICITDLRLDEKTGGKNNFLRDEL